MPRFGALAFGRSAFGGRGPYPYGATGGPVSPRSARVHSFSGPFATLEYGEIPFGGSGQAMRGEDGLVMPMPIIQLQCAFGANPNDPISGMTWTTLVAVQQIETKRGRNHE